MKFGEKSSLKNLRKVFIKNGIPVRSLEVKKWQKLKKSIFKAIKSDFIKLNFLEKKIEKIFFLKFSF